MDRLNDLLAGGSGLASLVEVRDWYRSCRNDLLPLLVELKKDNSNRLNVVLENLTDSFSFKSGRGKFRNQIIQDVNKLIQDEVDLRQKDHFVAGFEPDFDRDPKTGALYPTQNNLIQILKYNKHIRLCYDNYTGDVYYEQYGDLQLPWSVMDQNYIEIIYPSRHQEKEVDSVRLYYAFDSYEMADLKSYLSKHFLPNEVSWRALRDAMLVVARQNQINIYQDWMRNGLPEWDGVDRMDFLHRYAGVKDRVWAMVAGHMLTLGMVARCFEPGYDYRGVILLEGKENIGKSWLCKELAFHEQYFTQFSFTKNLDGYEIGRQIKGMAVVEFPDKGGIDNKSNDFIKAFFTNTHDRNRKMHQDQVDHVKRVNIFIITCNVSGRYLRGDTGNTRMVPAHCDVDTMIDVMAIKRELPQILAQAKYLWNYGITPRLTSAELILQRAQLEPREVKPDYYYWVLEQLKLHRAQMEYDENANWDDGFTMDEMIGWMENEVWFSSKPKTKHRNMIRDVLPKYFHIESTQKWIPAIRKRINDPNNSRKWRYIGTQNWNDFIDGLED